MFGLFRHFESSRPFTDHEAWTLFRLAALAEAVGWTLLITGLALKQFALHGNNLPVLIAGQFHGIIFLTYLVAAFVLYPSLGWSRTRAFFAIACGIPPYGSLVFELWAAHKRRHTAFTLLYQLSTYQALLALTETV